MSLIDSLIREIENESVSMVKSLERVPADKFDWKPHEKSTSLKGLALHLAQLGGMTGLVLSTDELDLANGQPAPEIKSGKDLVAVYNEGKENSLKALKAAKEEDLNPEWTLRHGDHIIMKLPKKDVIRTMALSHAYHHRAQLGVYLRLLGVPVPSVYGPSADEQ